MLMLWTHFCPIKLSRNGERDDMMQIHDEGFNSSYVMRNQCAGLISDRIRNNLTNESNFIALGHILKRCLTPYFKSHG